MLIKFNNSFLLIKGNQIFSCSELSNYKLKKINWEKLLIWKHLIKCQEINGGKQMKMKKKGLSLPNYQQKKKKLELKKSYK